MPWQDLGAWIIDCHAERRADHVRKAGAIRQHVARGCAPGEPGTTGAPKVARMGRNSIALRECVTHWSENHRHMGTLPALPSRRLTWSVQGAFSSAREKNIGDRIYLH
jgi:hypothetical protein